MPTLNVDGIEVEVEAGSTVLQACEAAGIEIPRFCFHERLSISGNCRMCLVEMEKAPKLIASCAMPAGDGMVIHTKSEKVKRGREGVLEFTLINHPLDCPVCDQGGECDLQDQYLYYSGDDNRYEEGRRIVAKDDFGPLVKTVMTRCIHCTRCVRFADEIAGVPALGGIGRGDHMEITTYKEQPFASELSGNVVDLCPVGALTNKPYAFTARPWELKSTETFDVHDAMGASVRADARGREVMRFLPRVHEDVNEEWISDKTRQAVDGLKYKRLDTPYVRKDGVMKAASWDEAFDVIAQKVKGLSGDKIAGLVGDLCDMESMYALKGLLGSLGSTTIDCRQDGAKYGGKHRVGYLFNTSIAGIDEADAALLVGTNPRKEAAVLNIRLRYLSKRGAIASVGEQENLTYPVLDLGDTVKALEELLKGKGDFAKTLKAAKKPMIILGSGAVCHPDGATILKLAHDIADKFGMVKKDWNGFNMLHHAASRVGAMDLGLVSDLGVNGILDKAASGDIEVIFNLGADEFDSARLEKAFVVYQGHHGDEGVKHADVILPGVAYTEKPGTYINLEGRVQVAPRAIFGPGEAREDWTILRALSEKLGHTLPYDNLAELRNKLVLEFPQVAKVDQLPKEEWADFGVAGTASETPISNIFRDFYQTNPIARASKVMAECSTAYEGAKFVAEAKATNG
ncbi:NADH-quinone oxidoreductase subunit NuoG [Paremcibacter congregatus]|uniref:NADH-quinone oxidoreductase n=1 Tax=Paremcibacter congregatus TaxID=2043170 RepID=A0A2G4YSK3_9PROT|nr:NADH-quinone oxidoreductase subunit NuoG [Paremcibacter congregatus]PHZ85319.1 NADH-quinone oxidoreductase subunit G [Paremcibacter congregatus]QDE27749.1 NADH-quinone oxidoreductase subunit G [Paremcibacter congregatus]